MRTPKVCSFSINNLQSSIPQRVSLPRSRLEVNTTGNDEPRITPRLIFVLYSCCFEGNPSPGKKPKCDLHPAVEALVCERMEGEEQKSQVVRAGACYDSSLLRLGSGLAPYHSRFSSSRRSASRCFARSCGSRIRSHTAPPVSRTTKMIKATS